MLLHIQDRNPVYSGNSIRFNYRSHITMQRYFYPWASSIIFFVSSIHCGAADWSGMKCSACFINGDSSATGSKIANDYDVKFVRSWMSFYRIISLLDCCIVLGTTFQHYRTLFLIKKWLKFPILTFTAKGHRMNYQEGMIRVL